MPRVDDLLEPNRLIFGKTNMKLKPFDLNTVIDDAMWICSTEAAVGEARLEV